MSKKNKSTLFITIALLVAGAVFVLAVKENMDNRSKAAPVQIRYPRYTMPPRQTMAPRVNTPPRYGVNPPPPAVQ